MSMTSKTLLSVFLLVFCFFLAEPRTLFAEELTLGVVQSKVKKGMSQGDVALAIGSPNIASKDRDGKETWIYDKISSATETEEQKVEEEEEQTKHKSSNIFRGIFGTPRGEASKKTKATTNDKTKVVTEKKTLTVVIKFDEKSLVKDVNYHMSKF